MGQALSPIYLHKVDLTQLLVYNQSLTTASESQLFGSVVLEHWSCTGATWVDSQRRHGKFFSYALLCYGYHVVRICF